MGRRSAQPVQATLGVHQVTGTKPLLTLDPRYEAGMHLDVLADLVEGGFVGRQLKPRSTGA